MIGRGEASRYTEWHKSVFAVIGEAAPATVAALSALMTLVASVYRAKAMEGYVSNIGLRRLHELVVGRQHRRAWE